MSEELERQIKEKKQGGVCQVMASVVSIDQKRIGRLSLVSCDAVDMLTCQTMKNLPCSGLDIRIGDRVIVTVSR